jgi:large conductance mechanosensitive channel
MAFALSRAVHLTLKHHNFRFVATVLAFGRLSRIPRSALSLTPDLEEEPHMKKMLNEFREFAVKGNVVDLAVGVIIGAAFGRIVESIVGDMVMPIFGAIGGLDFSNYFIALSKDVTATNLADAKKQGPVIAWGNFITIAINFAIVAGALFFVVKGINYLRRKAAAEPEAAKPAEPPRQEKLLEEIRDLLAKKG